MMNEELISSLNGLTYQAPPPDAFLTTWPHIYAVAAFSTVLGMIGGAAIMYVRLYLNGELVGRQPRRQKHRRGDTLIEDPDETDEQTSSTL